MLVLFINIVLVVPTVLYSRGRNTVPCMLSVSWSPPDMSKNAMQCFKKKLYEFMHAFPCSFRSAMTTRNLPAILSA